MYMRLWWKDARQFWPVWVFLVLAASVAQALVLHYGGPEVRQGAFPVIALGWTSLYAFAVGAAAFAGERENGTLRLLDLLPASRWVVWAGKVSFALATTLALAATLLAIAGLGTDSWTRGLRATVVEALFPAGVLVLQALGWGLFFSAIMSNALLAAVAAICFTGLSWSVILVRLDEIYGGRYRVEQWALWHLAVLFATLVASLIAFTWSRRTRRVRFGLRFQSPIVVVRVDDPRSRRAPAPMESPRVSAPELVPVPIPAVGLLAGAAAAEQPRPRSWRTETIRLIWETIREGRPTWFLLAAIGLVFPAYLLLSAPPGVGADPRVFPLVSLNSLVALAAGVSVFGLENRARTYRFLAHHGARPGIIWLAKLASWCFGLAVIWLPLVLLAAESPMPRGPSEDWIWIILTLPLSFAVALLCGMTIRRGITAWVVALVVTLGLALAMGAMVQALLLPAWGLLILSAALLAVTWMWSGDWLMDRPAPGRWLRFGLILTGTFAVFLGWYAGWRAWSVTDAGPIALPRAWLTGPMVENNAAELYREAGHRLKGSPSDNVSEFLSQNREALDSIRRAAARPDCRFTDPRRRSLFVPLDLPPMKDLARLVALEAGDRQRRGDLGGAWDDLVVLFRMARHVGQGATMTEFRLALEIERQGLGLAFSWAAAAGQTPERLRAALIAYRDLPPMIPAAEVGRAEAVLVERTIELPVGELKDGLLASLSPGPGDTLWAALWADLVTMPWERARASRVNRSYAAAVARDAALEPWQRWLGAIGSSQPPPADRQVGYDLESTPLTKVLVPGLGLNLAADDHNEVARRALVQVLAIRTWHLRHGGKFPDRLEDLVPEELPSLPVDPFSGRGFLYITQAQSARIDPSSPPGSRLLLSVGPDRRIDGAAISPGPGAGTEIVFPIPPLGKDAGANTPK
jgi:hypothetical protein